MINLDFLCMKTAQQMVDGPGKPNDKENLATKALGILLENGPYGLVLYFETPDGLGKLRKRYQKQLVDMCRDELIASYLAGGAAPEHHFEATTRWLQALAENLDRYLFLKRLWQQTLTYARYHAKALDTDEDAASAPAQGSR